MTTLFFAPWRALFPCFRWSFANGKTPIPRIGMEADSREERRISMYVGTPAFSYKSTKGVLK